jgi:hypothetical protein
VAKHLNKGIQRSIRISLALGVKGNETADTPEADELWLRLEVSVKEVDRVGDSVVRDVRGRAVQQLGKLRVAYDKDVEVKCIKYYIRSLESFLLYSSLALTFPTLDRQAPAILPQWSNKILKCHRDKHKYCHSALPVGESHLRQYQ